MTINKSVSRTISAATNSARVEKLNGKSPVGRYIEKEDIALDALYRHGFSSDLILDGWMHVKRRGFSNMLVAQGIAVKTPTGFVGNRYCMPSTVVTMTESGLAIAEKNREIQIPYEMNAAKHATSPNLHHDLMMQDLTQSASANGGINGYMSKNEIATQYFPGVKQFDSLWFIGQMKTGVELELSGGKWGRKLDQFATECLGAVEAGMVDQVLVISTFAALLNRYKEIFKAGNTIPMWEKNHLGYWKQSNRTVTVPKGAHDKVNFQYVKSKL